MFSNDFDRGQLQASKDRVSEAYLGKAGIISVSYSSKDRCVKLGVKDTKNPELVELTSAIRKLAEPFSLRIEQEESAQLLEKESF